MASFFPREIEFLVPLASIIALALYASSRKLIIFYNSFLP